MSLKFRGRGIFLFLILFTAKLFSQSSYYYKESFEGANPVKSWTSNATYTLNYFGTTTEKASDGSKSFKMDITINGNGTNDCYYYWQIPIQANLQGYLTLSMNIWMSSETANYVKIGSFYNFPPTGFDAVPYPNPVGQYNTWFTKSVILTDDVMYHADKVAKTKIYGSNIDDFGRELKFIPILIRGKGSHRLVFYIDNIELKGNILSASEFQNYSSSKWSAFQTRLSSLVQQRHTKYNSLPAVPSTQGVSLSAKAKEYLSKIQYSQKQIPVLFSQIDGKQSFVPQLMDSLDHHLEAFTSLVEMLKVEMSASQTLALFSMPPTVHNRLTGTNVPSGLEPLTKLKVRASAGEFEPMSIFMQPRAKVNNIRFNWTDFRGSTGTFPASALDVSVAKVWYQAGVFSTETKGRILTQELLVKNDELVKVDYAKQMNLLLVTDASGNKKYIDISTPGAVFPTDVRVMDSPTLLPINLDGTTNRQMWLTVKVPDNARPGVYTSTLTITADALGTVATVPIEIEVLPFTLDKSRLTYGIYYHGFLDNGGYKPYSFTGKSEAQLRAELQDMKDHGVLYPTTYQSLSNITAELNIRNQIGFPQDKLFTLGLMTGNPQTQSELDALKSKVTQWKNQIASVGYKDLYVYGIDEAQGDQLRSQRPAWTAARQAGAKTFVAGYYEMYRDMGDILDVGVILGELRKDQADLYHSSGSQIFSYSNPQVGQENPEIYRRNYGLMLWKNGYDGAMNYAYQKFYTAAWNDFDNTSYREETFTYPAYNGIIKTIEWEGFREGVDDIRYLSTLLNKIDQLKASGQDVSAIQAWVNSIDPTQDLDAIRDQIINKILELNGQSLPQDRTAPRAASVVVMDKNTLRVTFSEKISAPESQNAANYAITNNVKVNSASLGPNGTEVILKTTDHANDVNYQITMSNLKDVAGNLIAQDGRILQYRLSENTSNGNQSESGIPDKYELNQNYPNPFNPSTTIKFALPQKSSVSLIVYDILGKEVATLVNEVKEAGYYQVSFNGTNLASGTYIYRIKTEDFVETKKMLIVK